MKNKLKVWLHKNIWGRIPNDFKAEVAYNAEIGVNEIVDSLLLEGLCVEKKCAMEFIEQFNKKVAEYTLSGSKVDTGLVSLKAEVNSPIINKKWNADYNSINVTFEASTTFVKEIDNTSIEILGEKVDANETIVLNERSVKDEIDYQPAHRVVLNSNGEVPACGMAFRTWLCKS